MLETKIVPRKIFYQSVSSAMSLSPPEMEWRSSKDWSVFQVFQMLKSEIEGGVYSETLQNMQINYVSDLK